MENHTS